jgi:hypothetical protein
LSGSGKTTSIKGEGMRKGPDGKRVQNLGLPRDRTLIINAEPKGMNPLRDEGFFVVEVRTWIDFVDLINELAVTEEWKRDFDTIVIDSLTSISQFLETYIFSTVRQDVEKMRNKRAAAYANSLVIDEFGEYLNTMTHTINKVVGLEANVIVTCLADDRGIASDPRFLPFVSGRLRTKLPSFFDAVLYMADKAFTIDDKETFVRGWYTSNAETLAKNATGKPLDEFIAPDWSLIINPRNTQP